MFLLAHLEPVVGPATELHLAVLFVEWEPGDINLARRLEDARGDVGADTLASYHNIGRICSIKGLTGAEIKVFTPD